MFIDIFTFSCLATEASLISKTFEVLFYVALVNYSFFLSKFWMPDSLVTKIRNYFIPIFKSHGPAMTLILFFCTGDGLLKYLGGIVLLSLIYCFGLDGMDKIGKWDFDSLLFLFSIAAHHNGCILALYFQKPEEAWINTLLFGHFWWIHSKQLLDPIGAFIIKITGFETTEKQFHITYSGLTVAIYALWLQYFDLGANYQTFAVFLMVFGRNCANYNITHIEWMANIETPGVIVLSTWKIFGWSFGWVAAIVIAVVYYYSLRYFKERLGESKKVVPEKLIMNDKIRSFLKTYPRGEKPDENTIKGIAAWYDSMKFGEEFSIFRAIVVGDEVKLRELIKQGADVNQEHTKWFNSTPMQWCSGGGHIGCAILLMEAGANPFAKGVRKSARQFSKTAFLKFLEDLAALAFEALRDETDILRERQPDPGLTWDASFKLAQQKGGRLCTVEEALAYIQKAPVLPGEDQWCAVEGKDGVREWIQIGDKYHTPGLQHVSNWGAPTWGDNLDDRSFGKPVWQRILLYKLNDDSGSNNDQINELKPSEGA